MRLVVLCLLFVLSACNRWVVPEELLGTWETPVSNVAVRTHSLGEGFQFYKDTASASIIISADKTVSGRIGSATFENAKLEKNFGPPKITGIAWKVDVGPIGTIHPNDPLPQKEVQFWLAPVDVTMYAELRYTEGGAQFPMAGLVFSKIAE